MTGSDYVDAALTRALQESARVRADNLALMQGWGAYSLLKVTPRGAVRTQVQGYVTLLAAISGKTPWQMEDLLGLRAHQLAGGADIYRLERVPTIDEFLPRGYTTLVDGLRLSPGLRHDTNGYRPGLGAFQITLIKPVGAHLIQSLAANQPFDPGIHPSLRARYPA
jgi:hypothetical protein